ncbi:unnamed protein product [Protopolystoma xenopodis]|uniref:Uncharacterized protein n=1 Tax=Protopolystoma xenopodis TaxID=117903 RepID=A0A448WFX9_9PLAT|nr:unnamed protein product [Protopolystoma xenopodis]
MPTQMLAKGLGINHVHERASARLPTDASNLSDAEDVAEGSTVEEVIKSGRRRTLEVTASLIARDRNAGCPVPVGDTVAVFGRDRLRPDK